MKTSITKIFTFDAAHKIDHHDGKCALMHGHTYKLEVTVDGLTQSIEPDNPESGMILDFGRLKSIVQETVLEEADHSLLNDHYLYTTAEYMAQAMFNRISEALAETAKDRSPYYTPGEPKLLSVRLWETPTSYAEVTR